MLLPLYHPASLRFSPHSCHGGDCTIWFWAFAPFIWYSPFYFDLEKLNQVFLLWKVFHYFTAPHWQGLDAFCSRLNSYFWMYWLLYLKKFSNCLPLKLVISFPSGFKCCSSLHSSWHSRCSIIVCWIEFNEELILEFSLFLIYPSVLFLVEEKFRVLVGMSQKQILRYRLVHKKFTWKEKKAVVGEWRSEMQPSSQWNIHYQGSHHCSPLELNPAGETLKAGAEHIPQSCSTQGIRLLGYWYTNSFH